MSLTAVVTGANRGIGFEFAKQLLGHKYKVFATCRSIKDATELNSLKSQFSDQLVIVEMDVSKEQSIKSATEEITKQTDRIDLLINNAGVMSSVDKLNDLTTEDYHTVMNINGLAPLLVTKYLITLVKNSEKKTIANIGSMMGSIGDNGMGGRYVYRMSKAALNMATKTLALEFAKDNVIVLVVNPGLVKTDMTKVIWTNPEGNKNAMPHLKDADATVTQLLEVITTATKEQNGTFINFKKNVIPW